MLRRSPGMTQRNSAFQPAANLCQLTASMPLPQAIPGRPLSRLGRVR